MLLSPTPLPIVDTAICGIMKNALAVFEAVLAVALVSGSIGPHDNTTTVIGSGMWHFFQLSVNIDNVGLVVVLNGDVQPASVDAIYVISFLGRTPHSITFYISDNQKHTMASQDGEEGAGEGEGERKDSGLGLG
jgi:hypothetical protein